METSSDRGSDLEGGFSKRERGERNGGWRNQADSLRN